jgi:hypothetical protein
MLLLGEALHQVPSALGHELGRSNPQGSFARLLPSLITQRLPPGEQPHWFHRPPVQEQGRRPPGELLVGHDRFGRQAQNFLLSRILFLARGHELAP